MARRRKRSLRAGAAMAAGFGAVAGLFLFAVGAGALWATLAGVGVFGASLGTGLLLGDGAEGADLDDDAGAGLASDSDPGDLG